MRRSPQKTRRTLSLETLEGRQMMAGDVAVQMVGKVLHITGDNAANHVYVSKISSSHIRIEGANNTTINGQSNSLELKFGKGNSINANLNGGDDLLSIGYGVMSPGSGVLEMKDLTVDMGAGADTLGIVNANVGGKTKLHTGVGGSGLEYIIAANGSRFGSVEVQGDAQPVRVYMEKFSAKSLSIQTGGGQDAVELSQATIGGNLSVSTGDAVDSVNLNRLQVKGNLSVVTGAGGDTIRAEQLEAKKFHFDLGGGADYAVLKQLTGPRGKAADELNFDLGAGSDEVELYFARAKKMNVSMGTGNDVMFARQVEATTALFDGGLGDDYVLFENSKFQQLTATMGDGVDALYFGNTAVTKKLNVDGGAGVNYLYGAGLQKPSKDKDVKITNFTIL